MNWLRFHIAGFSRYSLVGLLSRGIQTALLWIFVEWAGVHYLPASILAVAIVHISNYAIHTLWTFRQAKGADDDD